MEKRKRPSVATAVEQMFDAITVLHEPFLQGDPPDKPPKQPCGETFKTKGRIHEEVGDKGFGLAQAIVYLAQCYQNAYEKAKRFCELLSEEGCTKVVFVKYDEFDSDVAKEGDKRYVTVEMTIVWKCAQPQ